jgi:putative DNA primase/helicase
MEIAIIGIMHFNKKTDVDSVLLRISDSQAFGAQARHAYAVIDDAENDRKLFVKGKNNNAPKEQKALAFTFSTKQMEDEDTGELFDAPYIVWQDEYVDITASEAMRAVAGSNKKPAARSEAKEFLESMLANGPVDADEIEEAAEANGISERTLRRAKKELRIIVKKKGISGGWEWQLPDQDDFSI